IVLNNPDVQKGFKETEKELIISILKKNNYSRAEAAKELNINPSTLWRKMKKLGIEL
ncbi:MAG: winged helix-turn-helix transcriptional regulator, partial [Ignavibacteria bacterium]|nr:winged helix-turn-helix transcriptional regulator [Ignavibacteria bacterium]